jgi:uncharacterized membrane protein YhiD involved in acid resistance
VAAIGLATACAPWAIVGLGTVIFIVVMVVLRMIEVKFHLKDHN